MSERSTMEWFDLLHILTTFAAKLREQSNAVNDGCELSRATVEIARDALIEALGLEKFADTRAEEAFNAAFRNGECFREARIAMEGF